MDEKVSLEKVNLFARIDSDLAADLKETVLREERDQQVIVARALRDYIAKSKAESKSDNRRAKASA
jgi:hypothetical protein